VEGVQTSTDLDGLTEHQLARLAAASSLTADERSVMTTTLERLREQNAARAEMARIEAELAVIEADIERLRKHLEAMGGDAGGEKTPVVERLLATEDELQAKRKELAAASDALDERAAATRHGLAALAVGG